MPGLRKLADVEGVLALSCSADGELVAVNDDRGRVRFLVTSPAPQWLPLSFSHGDVRAVLLHPDASPVCVLLGDVHPIVRIFDPWTGRLLRTLDPGLTLPDEDEDEASESTTARPARRRCGACMRRSSITERQCARCCRWRSSTIATISPTA